MLTDLSTKVGTIPLWVMSFLLCMCLGGTLHAETNSPPTYLACNDNINVSVDDGCVANITPELVLEGEESYPSFDPANYTVTVAGYPTAPAVLVSGLGSYAVTITEIDPITGDYVNSCWGNIVVEDKLAPIIGDDPSTPDDPLDPSDDEVACPCPVGNTLPECTVGSCLDYDALLAGDLDVPMPHAYDQCTDDLLVSFTDLITPGDDCSPTVVLRTYVFSDASGNKSTSCTNEYRLMPVDVTTDVVGPNPNIYLECGAGTSAQDIYNHAYAELLEIYLATATNAAEEAQAVLDAEADAYLYAYPTLNGTPLHSSSTFCNVATVSSDLEVYPCDVECTNMKKVIREWNVYNWCDNSSVLFSQIIVTQDIEGPDVTAGDLTVSVDPWGCYGAFDFPDPEHIVDNCSNKTSYTVTGPAGVEIFYDPDRGYYVTNAPKGDHVFYYNAVDCCGNVTNHPFNVYVVDSTPPVAIAKQDIVISLTTNNNGDGIAKLFTFNVDNGSYDGCSDVHLEIRREEDYCGIADNLTYNDDGHPNDKNSDEDEGEFVKFCCEDFDGAGVDEDGDGVIDYALIQVWLRVWDDGDMDGTYGSSGDNYNETWAYVRLEDKLTPTIQCPPNVTIGCEEDYHNLDLTGSATAIASCEPLIVEYQDIEKVLNGCGSGFIKRKWSVVSSNDIFCVQTITINGSAPGDIVINFPDDADVNCTDVVADEVPTWSTGPCDQMAWSVDVDTFYLQTDACFKVLKHWTVINWCTYDPDADDPDGIWEETQVIKVLDDIDPTFASCDDVLLEADDYVDSDNDGIICEANSVMLTQTAFDEGVCSSNILSWTVQVDINGDWTVDHEFSSELAPNHPDYIAPTSSGEEVKITIPGSIPGSMTGHRVIWRVTDGCGNYTVCTQIFMVVDQKPPTPYCQNISTAFMQNGMVAIWACDFDLGSFDNCTDYDDLRFTFSDTHPDEDPDYIQSLKCSSYTFDCDDVPSGAQEGTPIPVNMYVWDEKDNYSFCTVYLTILDNNNSCDDGTDDNGSGRMIAGNIVTPEGEEVKDVQVNLMSSQPDFPLYDMTDGDGHYAFEDVISDNNYVLEGNKNDDYINGVSTVDIILIQRHILNIAPFSSPYALVAADANGDEQVSARDMIDIRKLILGVYDEFPDSDSWVFIDQGQALNMPSPWPIDQVLDIQDLQSDMMAEDFLGIKVGDVNSSVVLNAQGDDSDFRSGEQLVLHFEDRQVSAGQVVEITLNGTIEDLFGMQFGLSHAGLVLTNVESETFEVSKDHFVTNAETAQTSFSLNANSAIQLDESNVLTIELEALYDLQLSEVLTIQSEMLTSEAYVGQNLESIQVVLQGSQEGFVLYQNRPNPFANSTEIGFVMPEAGTATLSVFDITGKVAYQSTKAYPAGMHSELITKEMLDGSGIWFYRLESGEFSDTKKLTVVK